MVHDVFYVKRQSFARMVARSVALKKIMWGFIFLLVSILSKLFIYEVSNWFVFATAGLAMLAFSDGCVVLFRESDGKYGDNDLEVSEAARYVIRKTKNGSGPEHFDRVFSDHKQVTAEVSVTGGAVAGAP